MQSWLLLHNRFHIPKSLYIGGRVLWAVSRGVLLPSRIDSGHSLSPRYFPIYDAWFALGKLHSLHCWKLLCNAGTNSSHRQLRSRLLLPSQLERRKPDLILLCCWLPMPCWFHHWELTHSQSLSRRHIPKSDKAGQLPNMPSGLLLPKRDNRLHTDSLPSRVLLSSQYGDRLAIPLSRWNV